MPLMVPHCPSPNLSEAKKWCLCIPTTLTFGVVIGWEHPPLRHFSWDLAATPSAHSPVSHLLPWLKFPGPPWAACTILHNSFGSSAPTPPSRRFSSVFSLPGQRQPSLTSPNPLFRTPFIAANPTASYPSWVPENARVHEPLP